MSSKIDQARHDAAVLPRIRDLESAGLSLRQIADQLQADGFPTPRQGSRWSYMAVRRILDRAGKSPGQAGEVAAKIPPSVTITVTGPVTTNAPMAQTGGEVTIEVSGTVNTNGAPSPTPKPETEPAEPPSKDSIIELAEANTLLAFPPWPHLRQYQRSLATLDLAEALPQAYAAALILPDPLLLKRRV